MKKPVICHLSNFSPEYPGSFIDALLTLAHYCRDQMGLDTLCIFPERASDRAWIKSFRDAGIECGFIPGRRSGVHKLQLLLRDAYPSIFHSHFFLYDLSTIFLKIAYYNDSKVIWHYHNPTVFTIRQRIKDGVKLKLLGRYFADYCIAVGNGVYDSLVEAGFDRTKLALIHNGIMIDRFLPDQDMRMGARQSLGVSDRHTVFLLLGWDPIRKGVDIFIKAAFELVRNRASNSIFLIAGTKETREFVLTIPEYHLAVSSVRVIDRAENFATLVNGIDVLVSCSRSEAFSYAIAEAMAGEKLVLCSDVPGMREIYGNSEGVWFFPNADWQRLAALLAQAQQLSAADKEHLGKVNSRYVAERYSLDTWADKIGKIYSNLRQS